jgi:hypothetical protein
MLLPRLINSLFNRRKCSSGKMVCAKGEPWFCLLVSLLLNSPILTICQMQSNHRGKLCENLLNLHWPDCDTLVKWFINNRSHNWEWMQICYGFFDSSMYYLMNCWNGMGYLQTKNFLFHYVGKKMANLDFQYKSPSFYSHLDYISLSLLF